MARYAPAAFTAAQTDVVIVSVGTGERFLITRMAVGIDGDCPVNTIDWKLEFDDSSDVLIQRHGTKPGSAWIEASMPGEYLAEGAEGQDVVFTCEDPAGGFVQVTINGFIVSTT